MNHRLVIERWTPPGLNSTMRGKIKKRITITDDCHALVAAEARRQGIPKAKEARRVRFVITFAKVSDILDPDNTYKCLLDSLKNCGLLRDDSYSYVETLPPVYFLGRPRTVVELEDIPVKTVEWAES